MASVRVATSHATLAGTGTYRPAGRPLGAGIADMVLTWFERARQRRQLREFSDHMLKDVGLSRADVENEMSKPFWRP